MKSVIILPNEISVLYCARAHRTHEYDKLISGNADGTSARRGAGIIGSFPKVGYGLSGNTKKRGLVFSRRILYPLALAKMHTWYIVCFVWGNI